MKDPNSLHQQVQAHIDCYSKTDPLREMSRVHADADKEEAALKWIALSALHGVNNGAQRISIHRRKDGSVEVLAAYRTATLPTPGPDVADRVVTTLRAITHIEGPEGELPLSLGMGNDRVGLEVKIREEDGEQWTTLEFEGNA